MNRSERRKLGKDLSFNKIDDAERLTLTREQWRTMMAEHQIQVTERRESQIRSLIKSSIFATLGMVLHDKFGFGRDRLNKVYAEIEEQYDRIVRREVTITDMKNELAGMGVNIEKW